MVPMAQNPVFLMTVLYIYVSKHNHKQQAGEHVQYDTAVAAAHYPESAL